MKKPKKQSKLKIKQKMGKKVKGQQKSQGKKGN